MSSFLSIVFSFTRITDCGVSFYPGTLSSVLPPCVPGSTQVFALVRSGLTHSHVCTDVWKLLKGSYFVPVKDLDGCEERKWVMGVEKVKQKARAEAILLFANEWNSIGFFADVPPVLYLETCSLSPSTPQTVTFNRPYLHPVIRQRKMVDSILQRYNNNSNNRASLVVQWLRVCLPMQGTRVRALVWEDPTCHGATEPVSHNCWACASGACAPQQERPR